MVENFPCICSSPTAASLFHTTSVTSFTYVKQVTALACSDFKYGNGIIGHPGFVRSTATNSSSSRIINDSATENLHFSNVNTRNKVRSPGWER